MSKRIYLLLLGLTTLATGAGVGITSLVVEDPLPPLPGVTEANAARLRGGMTPDEVIEILGPEALSYWRGRRPPFACLIFVKGKYGSVVLEFGPSGRLIIAAWSPA